LYYPFAADGIIYDGEPSEDDDEGLLVLDTPPRRTTPPARIGESQGGATITVALRPSPEQRRRAPGPNVAAPLFRLFPAEDEVPPTSTAPPRLEEGGRRKRKRAHTEKYEQAVAQGDLDESQHGKIGRTSGGGEV
jgi:hypothetical protein